MPLTLNLGENVFHPMLRLCLGFLATLIALLPPQQAHSGERQPWLHEIRLGLLDHDTDNLWSGAGREDGLDLNVELAFSPHLVLWHGQIRPNLGLSVNDRGNTSKIYVGGVWQHLWRNGLIFDLGAGLAVHDGEIEDPQAIDRKQMGSRVLVRFAAEIGYALTAHNRLLLLFDHVSNGYTADPNEGLDTVGIRYGYLF